MFDVTIPQLTDEQLLEKYRAIKPLVRDEEDGKLYWIEGKEDIEYLRGVAYDWTPKKIREVEKDELHVVDAYTFACLHTLTGTFRATIAEVLSQINYPLAEQKVHLGGTTVVMELVGFEIVDWPKSSDDLYKDYLTAHFTDLGYNVSTVKLHYSGPNFHGFPEGV